MVIENNISNSDSSKKKVALHTLGCRLNFSETGSLAQGFVDRGYEIVEFGGKADVTLINTCTVTDAADSSCRNLIRRAHKSSPEGKIVVVGCYAQMEPEKISSIQGVDLILGNTEKYKVFDYLNEEQQEIIHVDLTNDFWGATTTSADDHTRAFLKIQDGCNYICSYCIIPQARGRSRAISIEDAVMGAKKLVGEGFKEIVLTGVNIGEYERSSGERFHHLVQHILEIKDLKRLRLSSVEPNTITDELLDILRSSDKFMDHFHIPLQSGDDKILHDMRRRYTALEYTKIIHKIKNYFPNAGIGADIIVGFPGESEEQFNLTYNLLKELPITHFHVFPFSKRKGTLAARMDNHIHSSTKKSRAQILTLFGNAKLQYFMENNLGKTSQVLFERRGKEGFFEGYTSNFLRVAVESSEDLSNQIRAVFLKEISDHKIKGELLF